MGDPLSVECPDCAVPAGRPCATSVSSVAGATHGQRQRLADLRSLEHGTCALCHRPMVRGSVEGSPVDAWHPDPTDAAACPPLPDPNVDWNAWATQTNLGLTAGHPGVEQFVPTPQGPAPTGVLCPECATGKPVCAGMALDPVTDELVPCAGGTP